MDFKDMLSETMAIYNERKTFSELTGKYEYYTKHQIKELERLTLNILSQKELKWDAASFVQDIIKMCIDTNEQDKQDRFNSKSNALLDKRQMKQFLFQMQAYEPSYIHRSSLYDTTFSLRNEQGWVLGEQVGFLLMTQRVKEIDLRQNKYIIVKKHVYGYVFKNDDVYFSIMQQRDIVNPKDKCPKVRYLYEQPHPDDQCYALHINNRYLGYSHYYRSDCTTLTKEHEILNHNLINHVDN